MMNRLSSVSNDGRGLKRAKPSESDPLAHFRPSAMADVD